MSAVCPLADCVLREAVWRTATTALGAPATARISNPMPTVSTTVFTRVFTRVFTGRLLQRSSAGFRSPTQLQGGPPQGLSRRFSRRNFRPAAASRPMPAGRRPWATQRYSRGGRPLGGLEWGSGGIRGGPCTAAGGATRGGPVTASRRPPAAAEPTSPAWRRWSRYRGQRRRRTP
jgi:hypothetical protein